MINLSWLTRQQLKHEHAQRPVIGANVMATIQYHLGSNILGCATECPRFASRLQFLGKSKVHQLHIALLIQQEILRLQISVDYIARMEIIEGLYNACGIESCCGIIEISLIPQYGP